MAFLIDLGEENYLEAFDVLQQELEAFSPELCAKKRIIIGTKLDLEDSGVPVRERLGELKGKYHQEQVLGMSVFSGEGMPGLVSLFSSLVEEAL